MIRALVLIAGLLPSLVSAGGLWIDAERLAGLPVTGPAWMQLRQAADLPVFPDLSDKDNPGNVHVMAKALVYARLGEESYRQAVIAAIRQVMGTERHGNTLALGRNLGAYVIAADLVQLPKDLDVQFRRWLRRVMHARLDGRTLVDTHEQRPNNWGTHAGGSRAVVAAYLGDRQELERVATVFRGWLGDRDGYHGFRYRDRSWQADAGRPVGINPAGARKQGHDIDGVLPDDQRRGGSFSWPPSRENYAYEALQGALLQAVILHRAGFDVWNWQDRALLRAFRWLHQVADFPAEGDDTWQPHLVNYYYGSEFPAPVPARPGKNIGWTDWTHARR